MATWQPPQTAPRPLHVGAIRGVRVAAALAAVLLVGGLVMRGSLGLSRQQPERIVRTDPETGAMVADGGIELTAAAGAPLFDDVHLAPGETVAACVRVDYRGDVDPDAVAMSLGGITGSHQLARDLQVAIQRGTMPDGGAGCGAFVPKQAVAAGRLADLAAQARDAATGWRGWDPTSGEASAWYRISVTLDAAVAPALQGARAETGFVWSAVAAPTQLGFAHRVAVLAGAVARDTVLPVLLLVAIAILFLGIQDRIDRRDPKLALAPVTTEPLVFVPSAPVASPPAAPRVRGTKQVLAASIRGGGSWHA